MHLIERYSLGCGAKIGKPQILEKFFPLTVDRFITLHPNSKYSSKCYDYWQDVVNYLIPYLSKLKIAIVQIGTKEDKPLRGCYTTNGQTTIGQVANILARTELHLGADSFATHVASGYGKKIVCLYSNNFINVVRPYWTAASDCFLLEPDRLDEKPSFSADEPQKSINGIRPEDIASSVLTLLNIKHSFPKETIFVGKLYGQSMIEMVPNQIINPKTFNTDIITVRMDFLFDEAMLIEQVKRSAVSLITNKPISKGLLERFRDNIKDIVYELDEEHNPNFARTLLESNIQFHLISKVPDDKLGEIKLKYLDYGLIHIRGRIEQDTVTKIKGLNREMVYKSSKYLLSDGKIYPSRAAWEAGIEATDIENQEFPIIDSDIFWRELDCYRILSTKKTD